MHTTRGIELCGRGIETLAYRMSMEVALAGKEGQKKDEGIIVLLFSNLNHLLHDSHALLPY